MRLIILASLTLCLAVPALAQTPPAPPAGGQRIVIGGGPNGDPRIAAFAKSDANKDGKLDKTEFGEMAKALGAAASADTIRAQVDKNKDGFVTLPEYAESLGAGANVVRISATPEDRAAAFKAHDKNKDNKLTRTEYGDVMKQLGFPGDVEPLWTARDADKDGFVTLEEYNRPMQPIAITQTHRQ